MFFGPNPAHWPAFWLLTANGGCLSIPDKNGNTPWGAPAWKSGASDELDILEGYLGNPESYQIAAHEWGYSTGKGCGVWVNLNQAIFQYINLAEGFHTLAVLITEDTTYYYCDNILVFKHETLRYSWELGNYFIINGGLSDHFGFPKAEDDTFDSEHQPWGFTRYGNECYDYVDWVRVWEDDPGTLRYDNAQPLNAARSKPEYSINKAFFETKHEGLTCPGSIIDVAVDRNPETGSIYGSYIVSFPDYPEFGEQGYKIIDANSGVNRLHETVRIQLPVHSDWVNKHDIIKIDPPGSGHKPMSITVKTPEFIKNDF